MCLFPLKNPNGHPKFDAASEEGKGEGEGKRDGRKDRAEGGRD